MQPATHTPGALCVVQISTESVRPLIRVRASPGNTALDQHQNIDMLITKMPTKR